MVDCFSGDEGVVWDGDRCCSHLSLLLSVCLFLDMSIVYLLFHITVTMFYALSFTRRP